MDIETLAHRIASDVAHNEANGRKTLGGDSTYNRVREAAIEVMVREGVEASEDWRQTEPTPAAIRLNARVAELEEILLNITSTPDNGTGTSKAAATRVNATGQRLTVLQVLSRFPDGLTAEEIQLKTGLGGNSVRPRLRECRSVAWVADTGDERKTLSGCSAVVWELTDEGARRVAEAVTA